MLIEAPTPLSQNHSKVFLIILNYNNWPDTIECLESIKSLDYPNFDIILCDNKSTNDSEIQLLTYIYKNFECTICDHTNKEFHLRQVTGSGVINHASPQLSLHYIQTNHNGGYAFGNNVGITYIYKMNLFFDYVWLLNNDTLPDSESLTNLVQQTRKNYSIGLCGSVILDYKSERIQCVGGSHYSVWTGRMKPIHSGISMAELPHIQEENPLPSIDYIDGSAVFVCKAFLDTVGLMSENFFLFFEEADWSDRGKSKGFINGVSLSSFVIHKGGASTQHSLFSQYYLCRNHFIYLAKRAGWRKFYLIPIICFIKMLKYYLIANNKGLDTVVEALHDALTFKN